MPNNDSHKGLYRKYNISKADGSPVDTDAEYFVLKLDNNPGNDKVHIEACRQAAMRYATVVKDTHLEQVGVDLLKLLVKQDIQEDTKNA